MLETIIAATETTFVNVVPFLIVLTIAVFFHELGHYAVARACGVRVEVFSVGFGREIFGFNDRSGTRWRFSIVPLGGYVRMFGEPGLDDEDADAKPAEMSPEEKAVSFNHKSLAQRAAIVAAGPLANLVLAIVIFFLVSTTLGLDRPLSVVGQVVENSAAAEAGMVAGDKIIEIDGEPIKFFADLQRHISSAAGRELSIKVERGDQILILKATPRLREGAIPGQESRGFLGIQGSGEHFETARLGLVDGLNESIRRTFGAAEMMLGGLGMIFTGQADPDELGGPVKIAQISGEMANAGLIPFLFFIAVLSINLCLINLLPIPVLDGGHLFFYVIEAVLGRPLSPRAQEYSLRFGLVLVLGLMVFVTWNDIAEMLG